MIIGDVKMQRKVKIYSKYRKDDTEGIEIDLYNPHLYNWENILKNYTVPFEAIYEIDETNCDDLETVCGKNIINNILQYQEDVSIYDIYNLYHDYERYIDYDILIKYHNLDEDYMREKQDKLNWTLVSSKQKLSEEFIEEFADRLDWDLLTLTQDFSDEFMEKHKDKINWDLVSILEKARLTGDELQKLL